ncbi:hypothetical protein D6774_04000 [Candidatus Woesearchaeota archaeon]|nr:MAG: hypothetical protein D6774_04000 [Candidatus Woesearchaeota archaeon]
MIELGGNITLVGFSDLDDGSLIILKKMVGNSVRKIQDNSQNFEGFTLTCKNVHSDNKFELHAKLIDNGKVITSQVTDFNLFYTLDKVLKAIHAQQS